MQTRQVCRHQEIFSLKNMGSLLHSSLARLLIKRERRKRKPNLTKIRYKIRATWCGRTQQRKTHKLQQVCSHLVTDLLSTSRYQHLQYSHGLRQFVEDKFVASCQQTCCILIVKTDKTIRILVRRNVIFHCFVNNQAKLMIWTQ